MKHTHHHFLITFAILVTLFVVAIFFYMKAAITRMTDRAVVLRGEAIGLQSGEDIETKLKNLEYNSPVGWNRLFSTFIRDDDAVSFIEYIESIGSTTGSEVSITSIDNIKPEDGSLITNGYMTAKVKVTGSWAAVYKAFLSVEDMPYLINIRSVHFNISGDKKTDGPAKWEVSFDIVAIKSI